MAISGLGVELNEAVEEALEMLYFSKRLQKKITAVSGEENYIRIKKDEVIITYASKASLFAQLKFAVMGKEGAYNSKFKNLSFMADCSRNAVLNIRTVKELIKLLALMGYNELQLYTEDTYEIKEYPYFGYLRGRFTAEEIKEIDDYAARFGIELIPCIQTLAHLDAITRWPVFGDIIDCKDILLCEEPKTYELLEAMFKTVAQNFSSRKINIGFDEAHMAGLGKYLDKHGYKNRFEILTKHLKRVRDIAQKYGFNIYMWSDMFFRLNNSGDYYGENTVSKSMASEIPSGINQIYWDYYHEDESEYARLLDAHSVFDGEKVFAGGAWKWACCCPFNALSIARTEKAMRQCVKAKVTTFIVTAWGDDGAEAALFSVLPALCYAGAAAWGREDTFKEQLKVVSGIDYTDWTLLERAVDFTAFGSQYNISAAPKYLLYNDIFSGIYDYTLLGVEHQKYSEDASAFALAKRRTNGRYGYIFDTLHDLVNALAVKAELGSKTRTLYRARDFAGLAHLANNDYLLAIKRVKEYAKKINIQWEKENKGGGLEVLQARIGGLIHRLTYARLALIEFSSEKRDKIDQLEMEILGEKGHTFCPQWYKTFTANIM